MVCVHDSQDTSCGIARIARRHATPPAQCTGIHARRLTTPRAALNAHPRPTLGGGPNLLQVHADPERAAVLARRFLAPADEPVHDPLLLQARDRRMRRHAVIGALRAGPGPRRRGQALVEFALVFPLFLLVLFSIIAFGLYVFYNQQLANAAREAARYAAVHSSTAQCPTVSRLDPAGRPPARERHVHALRCAGERLAEDDWRRRARRSGAMAPTQVSCRPAGPATSTRSNNYDALPAGAERLHGLHDQRRQSEDGSGEPRLPGARRRSRRASMPAEGRRRRQGQRSSRSAPGDDHASTRRP